MIRSFDLSRVQKLKLMEFGLLPDVPIRLMHKNIFGSVIIKCKGTKYAIDSQIASKLIITQSSV